MIETETDFVFSILERLRTDHPEIDRVTRFLDDIADQFGELAKAADAVAEKQRGEVSRLSARAEMLERAVFKAQFQLANGAPEMALGTLETVTGSTDSQTESQCLKKSIDKPD